MSKTISLKKVAKYSDARIPIKDVTIDNFVTTDNLLQNKLGITKATSLPPQDGNMSAYFKNDILIGNIRPYLKKIWFADKDGGNSADVLTIKVNEKHNPKFIYYALYRDDFFEHMMKGSKGTKMPRGDKNQIMDFSIPDINLESEEKIANILSSLDSKIELNNKINKELESMSKTLYDYWFVQFDFPNENGKPYKSSGGKMVYNQELKREIPEGWAVKNIFKLMDVQYGFPFDTSKFTDDVSQKPIVRIRDILQNTISTYSSEEIDNKFMLNKNDLLIGMDGNFHINFWNEKGAYLNQRSVRIRTKEDGEISNLQVYFEITPYIKAREKNVSRTTVGHLSDKDLKSLFLLVPNIKLNHKSIFDSILNKLVTNKVQNQELAKLRDWLLPMLMNGQVRVK